MKKVFTELYYFRDELLIIVFNKESGRLQVVRSRGLKE